MFSGLAQRTDIREGHRRFGSGSGLARTGRVDDREDFQLDAQQVGRSG
jgi:hypothetical protein